MTVEDVERRVGGIVLCGGESRRMGRPKAWLPFGERTMLQQVIGVLREVVEPIVVVAAPQQELPELPADVEVLRDEQPALGPLPGIGLGLRHLADRVEAAYVSSCDVPLLRPAFVRRMVAELGSHELAVPREGRFHHPLAAVYRTTLYTRVAQLVAEDRRRPLFLVEESDARLVDVDELRSVDPELDSLRNANTPDDYAAILTRAGLDPSIAHDQ